MFQVDANSGLLIEPLDLREQGCLIVGDSAPIIALLDQIEDAAFCASNVLITGERGTGKGLVAREIHRRSDRKGKPFINLNSAAIPEGLFESELFGYERGAFTGAVKSKIGRFEMADRGTLFLDEVAELPPGSQSKLLRVLEDGGFERVGGLDTHLPDTRVIAATNQNLSVLVKQGRFRADLLDRLGGVFQILTPPLREHREDLRMLIPSALAMAVAHARLDGQVYMESSAASLLIEWNYPWPGNVRQFEQFIERLAVCAKRKNQGIINRQLVQHYMLDVRSDDENETELNQDYELIERALRRANGNKSKAARDLGWTRARLEYQYNKWLNRSTGADPTDDTE
ncbi:MAG: sigma-54-dependent Fis family transcriptional regulator [Chloracidobacterium sp.]|nr:sigma-54-dependent Fis family transcriptional regulator [Chloracidobacterium sp.]